jgi:hypothetical protein
MIIVDEWNRYESTAAAIGRFQESLAAGSRIMIPLILLERFGPGRRRRRHHKRRLRAERARIEASK